MSARPVSLRIPDDVKAAIEQTASRAGRAFSSVANEMLSEAVRMRRIPGIVFTDGPAGRRARIAGTGIDVFELVRDHRALGRDWEQLRAAYHWLDERQLRVALAYAEAYPRRSRPAWPPTRPGLLSESGRPTRSPGDPRPSALLPRRASSL